MEVKVIATAYDGKVYESNHYSEAINNCRFYEEKIISDLYYKMKKNVLFTIYDINNSKLSDIIRYHIVHILNKTGLEDINKYCKYKDYKIIFTENDINKHVLLTENIRDNIWHIIGNLETMVNITE